MKSETRSCFRGLSFFLIFLSILTSCILFCSSLPLFVLFLVLLSPRVSIISPCVFFPSVFVSRSHSSFPLVSPASPAFFVLQLCFAPRVPSVFPVLHWFVLVFFQFLYILYFFNSWFLLKLAFCSFTCLPLSVFSKLQHSCHVLMCSVN